MKMHTEVTLSYNILYRTYNTIVLLVGIVVDIWENKKSMFLMFLVFLEHAAGTRGRESSFKKQLQSIPDNFLRKINSYFF